MIPYCRLVHFFLIIISFHYSLTKANDEANQIKWPFGIFIGDDHGNYISYEGIPYAEPPIGDLRFKAPKPYKKWNAIHYSNRNVSRCLQWNPYDIDNVSGQEDCLTLNIYKPKGSALMKNEAEKLPVLVFIHGGGFMFGSPNDYGVDYLMESGKVILVKIAYRLGPLGFLSTGDDIITGNFGLKDQRLALQWIKKYISYFDGDDTKILLMGFSAGAASVHLHMLKGDLDKYCKAAISFSGVALNPWVIMTNARENAYKMASHLNCSSINTSQDILNCLQKKSGEEIVSAVKYFYIFASNPFTTFGPVVEHAKAAAAFITQSPRYLIKQAKFRTVPWLASYTTQDGAYTAAELLYKSSETGRELIYDLNSNWQELLMHNLFLQHVNKQPRHYASELKRKYLGDKEFTPENYNLVQDMYTDIIFKNGIVEALQLHSASSKSAPVYSYVFNVSRHHGIGAMLSHREDIEFGSNHFDDLSLIFSHRIFDTNLTEIENMLSNNFINMLVTFVTKKQPSFGNCTFINNVGHPNDLKYIFINEEECKDISAN